MKKATLKFETREGIASLGRNDKRFTYNQITVIIENYGSMPLTSFVNYLWNNGRVDIKLKSSVAKGSSLTVDFVNSLIEKNIDLFPNNF